MNDCVVDQAPQRFARFSGADAPSRRARGYLRALQQQMGFVPDPYQALAASSAALRVYGELAQHFEQATLTPTERDVVTLAVTRQSPGGAGDGPATAGAPASGLLDALRLGAPLPDARLQALRQFTEAAYHCRGRVGATTWAAFEAAGYGPAQALEVLLGIALKVLADASSRMTGSEGDDPLAGWKWMVAARQAAPATTADAAQTLR